MSSFNNFTFFFGLQFLTYLNLTVNYRAVAHGQYIFAALTDIIAAILSWALIRWVSRAGDSRAGLVGLMCGASVASMVGIWLTAGWGN